MEKPNARVIAPPATQKVPTRSIILLAGAGFASQAMVRVTDSLLPQIAADFGTTVGAASIVVAAYSVSHGSIQLIIGPVGDRFGKYRTVAVMCALAAILVALCGTVQSISALAVARFASGAAAGWIIPMSAASRSWRAISPGRFSASCSARRRAGCWATCSAGATSSSCWRGCSRSRRWG
jgi:predicted MFS family arabinose efflux permease